MNRDDERVILSESVLVPSIVLALGVILAALVFGSFHYRSRAARDTIQVTGAATQPFESDIVKWRLVLSRPTGWDDLAAGYAGLARDLEQVRTRLQASGIAGEDVGIQPVNAFPMFDQFGNRTGYNLQQSLSVISGDVEPLESLALNPGDLIAGGVILESSQLEYFYSQLDSLKHRLLAKATADARVTEPFSTEVSGFGIHNTATKKKEITVTVHASFEME